MSKCWAAASQGRLGSHQHDAIRPQELFSLLSDVRRGLLAAAATGNDRQRVQRDGVRVYRAGDVLAVTKRAAALTSPVLSLTLC